MRFNVARAPFLFLLGWCGAECARTDARLEPHTLVCEYRHNPIGIQATAPRLSWRLPTDTARQTAYRLRVASSAEQLNNGRADIFDSGRIVSEQHLHVLYGGPALLSGRRYYWTVESWDEGGRGSPTAEIAWWQMGLLQPMDWRARWIGTGERLPENQQGLVGYRSLPSPNPSTEKRVWFDLGMDRPLDRAVLHPVRPGAFNDAPAAGYLFPVRFKVEVSTTAAPDEFTVVWDETTRDRPNPGLSSVICTWASRPVRHLRVTATRLAEEAPGSYSFALSEVELLNEGVALLPTTLKAGALDAVQAPQWSIRALTDHFAYAQLSRYATPGPAMVLRKSFELPARILRATVHATALGIYDVKINGREVGENRLAPEWTDYKQRIQYQSYDITDLLLAGANRLEATIAEGWYAGLVAWFGPRQYGQYLGFLLQLEAEDSTGARHTVFTDGTWEVSMDGPIRAADLIRGETWDARADRRMEWKLAVELPAPTAKLVAQPNEPIRVTGSVTPLAITEPTPGVFVADFGQNLAGGVRLKLNEAPDGEVQLIHGETVRTNGTVYTDNLRVSTLDPIRAYQVDSYRGPAGYFEPIFTTHGFRYVEIHGLHRAPAPGDITAKVIHSDATRTGTFLCSDPMLNRLMTAIDWTIRSNLMGVPTDCPQRAERMGWLGDAMLVSQTSIFQRNVASFLTKWHQDILDAQSPDGRFPDFAPNPVAAYEYSLGAPGWGDVGVRMPWRVFENYGDRRILEISYPAAKRWMEFVCHHNPDLIWRHARGKDFADWLNGDKLVREGYPPSGADTPREVFATFYFKRTAETLAWMAAELGQTGDAARYAALADGVKNAFQREFVRADGSIVGDTQTVYAFALNFEMLSGTQRTQAVRRLLEKIEAYNGRLSTGIQGTPYLMQALADVDQIPIAYRFLLNREFPSWGYMLENGATTIWERWDGFVKGRPERDGFQKPGMNSFNHPTFGAIGEWIYRHVLGIKPDPTGPGFRIFRIQPRPGGGLTFARGGIETMYGRIESDWRIENDRFLFRLEVPAGTTAKLYVPGRGGHSLQRDGSGPVEEARYESGFHVVQVGPGQHAFTSRL
jgi:alpha-L-rhamnosidase